MQATSSRSTGNVTPNPVEVPSSPSSSNLGDPERGLPRAQTGVLSVRSIVAGVPSGEEATEMQPTSSSSSTTNFLRHKTSQIFDAVMSNSKNRSQESPIAPALASLVDAYANSTIAAEIKTECQELREVAATGNGHGSVSNELPDVALETSILRGRKRASYGTQFRILSGRAFKNLYRDPALLTAHYASAITLAVICGFFYHNVT